MEAPSKRQKLSLPPPSLEENELQEVLRILCHVKKIEGIAHIQATIEAFMGPPPRTIAQACKLNAPKLLRQVIAKVDNEPGDSLRILPAFRVWQFEQGMENAVVAGHLEMAKVLAVSFPTYQVAARVVQSALSHGRLDILRWLFAYRQNIDVVVDTRMVVLAVKSGDLETVKWAHAQCVDEELAERRRYAAGNFRLVSASLAMLARLLEQAASASLRQWRTRSDRLVGSLHYSQC